MHQIVWIFRPAADRDKEFTAAYGPDGVWVRLFRRGAGYLGTCLEAIAHRPGWYQTLDRWASREAYARFRAEFREEYEAADRACAMLTAEEHALTDVRLQTPRLVLRELAAHDAAALNEIERDPRVTRYMSYDPQTPEQSAEYISAALSKQAEMPRRSFDLAVTLRESEQLVGRCGVEVTRPVHREAMIWYELHPGHWGRGLAGEAARTVVRFAFAALGMHRVWADCDPRNAASCRLAERLGMKCEGVLRENYWLKGEWCSTAVYAMLKGDWRSLTSSPGASAPPPARRTAP